VTGTLLRPRLRELRSSDRGRIADIVQAVGIFRDEEIQIALEIFDSSCLPFQTDYQTVGIEWDSRLAGWICWGSTPCTVGTVDLYWMAVDPACQGLGLGTALISEMERRLTGSARLIAIDTSGRPDYGPTRRFYQSRGYQAVAVVPDFYAPGDDQVIFTKALTGGC
jgi:ribosomal protein S18 acetylase RimI-like enzyme